MKIYTKYKVVIHLFIIFLSVLVIVYRRQDSFLNAQFFAEDGTIWFSQAHAFGLRSLLIPTAGYFQTSSRVIALFSTLFDYSYGPIIFNVYALLIQLLPIMLILSRRYIQIDLKYRLLSIVVYLALFNTSETYLNVTNAQWYLALSLCLVVFALRTSKGVSAAFDIFVVILSGLSGPFSIMLSATVLIVRKGFQFTLKERVLFLAAAIQIISLLMLTKGSRASFLSAVNLINAYDIWWRQVLWGFVAGPVGFSWIVERMRIDYQWIQAFSITGLYVVVYALIRADLQVRKAILFSIFVFVTSIFLPTVAPPEQKTSSEILFDAYGLRYWLLPMLGVYLALLWGLLQKNKTVRFISGIYLFLWLFFTVKIYRHPHNFTYPNYIDYDYNSYIETYKALSIGEKITIPINPKGWTMTLVK